MRQINVILAGICLASGLALADSLTINKVPYENVKVTDVSSGKITYEFNGREYEKQLDDVTYVKLSSQVAFSKAEDAFKDGKFADAVTAYNLADASPSKPEWLRRLIRYRRMPAAAAAKMPGQAIADWLGIVDDESGGGRVVVIPAPDTVAAKGSPENAKAIDLLEKRSAGGKGDVMFRAKLRDLLIKLYGVEGLKDKEMKLLGLSSGAPAASGPAGAGGERETGSTNASLERVSIQLEEAASLIKLGQYDTAIENIRLKLGRLTTRELPGALMLLGNALQLSYEKGGSKDAAKLKEAGLCFMRVAACFDPATPQVPEALYRSALVAKAMGNQAAATKAVKMLVDQYAASEWTQKARAAIAPPAAAPKKDAKEPAPTASTR